MPWNEDDTPYIEAGDDACFPGENGFRVSEDVFLAGNDLPARFAGGLGNRVLECGFGTGRNFLATAALFLELAPADATLEFVSLEKHPPAVEDLPSVALALSRLSQEWLASNPQFTAGAYDRVVGLQTALHNQWPDPVPGFHRRALAGGRVRLTMVWGDARDQLSRLDGRFDAFYLDDFSSDHDSKWWQEPLISELAQRAAPGATLATSFAAQEAQSALATVGFATRTRPVLSGKRNMLIARRQDGATSNAPEIGRAVNRTDAPIAVLGAGMAGATMARALARRGREVVVFEAGPESAGGGSGNPAGLVAPVISRDWNRLSQLTATGMGFMRAELDGLVDGEIAAFDGVIKLARGERHATKQTGIAAALEPDPAFAQWCGAERLRELTGLADIDSSGWWFPTAGWLRPRRVIAEWLTTPGIETCLEWPVAVIKGGAGNWQLQTADGRRHGPFAELIVAAGPSTASLIEGLAPWIEPCRGQVSWGTIDPDRSGTTRRAQPVMREGYALDLPSGERLFGASFLPGDEETRVRPVEHEENRRRLASIAPSLATGLTSGGLQGRASLRATTPDRLPIVGQVADGLWVTTGHGARGLTWSAWLAEYLAARIEGTPSPLPRDLAEGLEPARFDERAARKAGRSGGR
ncbi:MAG: FAD-dependent 5-carboxymethylaminomethyl-2-thiouridine(34) oxidoreductase MnmC [Guyparkeria sp.]